jgi:small conductance mechanosensitive channel
MTHGWSRAVMDIGVAYKEDTDRVCEVLLAVAAELRQDAEFGPLVLDDAEMLGVDNLGDSAVLIKMCVKTQPLKRWAVKRELLRRIKHRFDELDIEIPFPHRTVFLRQDEPAAAKAKQ